jgi:hypothetical protein
VEDCKFDDTLFLELTSLILWGELKIHFASVGTSYCEAMRFNTVTEGLYREAIDLLLDRIDQAPAQGAPKDDEDTTSIFEIGRLSSARRRYVIGPNCREYWPLRGGHRLLTNSCDRFV